MSDRIINLRIRSIINASIRTHFSYIINQLLVPTVKMSKKMRDTQAALKPPESKGKFSLPRSLNVLEFAQVRSAEIAQLTEVSIYLDLIFSH